MCSFKGTVGRVVVWLFGCCFIKNTHTVVLSGYPIARQLSSSLSISILRRPAKEAAVGAIGRMVTSTPFLEDQSTPASWNLITPCWTPGSEEASLTSPVVTDACRQV